MPRPPTLFKTEADLLGALAHPTRLQILEVLREGEACVCHIQATLRQRQAYVSQQLMALRQAGLVTTRKEGLRVYYQVSDPQILTVLEDVRAVAHQREKDSKGQAAQRPFFPPRGRCNCPQCSSAAQD